jgi:phospholipid/cholesterol/gamma-HCH transport system substrate-binding protein
MVVLALMIRSMSSGLSLGGSSYTVHADFADASNLVSGDDVDVSGVRVGHVSSITPTGAGAVATLAIAQAHAPLGTDATAMIRAKNLLGEAYVELTPGDPSQGAIPDGGTLPRAQTLTPVEVSQVLDALNPSVRDKLVMTINSLGQGLTGRGSDLNAQAADFRALGSDVQTLSGALAPDSAQLGDLVATLDKVIRVLATYHSQFRGVITDWDSVMQSLAAREQDLEGTFSGEDQLMSTLEAAMAGPSAADLNQAIQGAPHDLNTLSAYSAVGTPAYTDLAAIAPYIDGLFYELGSVMSAHTATGQHMWRVYDITSCQNASNPSVSCPP